MNESLIGRRLRIHGRVQGVFFRASAAKMAQQFGVDGWVRNRADGSVELAAYGPEAAVESLIRWCHVGPEQARVERVYVEPLSEPVEPGFTQRPSA